MSTSKSAFTVHFKNIQMGVKLKEMSWVPWWSEVVKCEKKNSAKFFWVFAFETIVIIKLFYTDVSGTI